MLHKNINWQEAREIAKFCRLITSGTIAILGGYFTLTIMAAILDGIGLTALVNLVAGGRFDNPTDLLTKTLYEGITNIGVRPSFKILLFFTLAVIFLRALLVFALQAIDGYIQAFLRRRIQDTAFSNVLSGEWEKIRFLRVGANVGAVTEEANIVAKYYFSVVRAFYYFLCALVLGVTSLLLSIELTLILAFAALPIMFVTYWILSVQSRVSKEQTISRQAFSADVSERFQNLFQIKIDEKLDRHIDVGLRRQHQIAQQEILIGYCQAGLATSKVIAPVVGLGMVYFWASIQGKSLTELVHVFAGIGLLGLRTVNQVDNLISTVGVLSRVSGSLLPVYNLIGVERAPSRELIPESLQQVIVADATYKYHQGGGVANVTLRASCGQPLIIRGPSGAGKSTLANLIAGLLLPQFGKVEYFGESGKYYSTSIYRANIGYVTQDIQLFSGTLRDNLTSFSSYPSNDNLIWESLRLAGAKEFVEKKGGLDSHVSESGGGLSGGEKRRLGIARVLITSPQILILDEITSGLDAGLKSEILETISDLSTKIVTILITHDSPTSIENIENTFVINHLSK